MGRAVMVAAAIAALICLALPLEAQQNARDDENLIRGLLRDGLIEVAADRIFDFVFKYPDHPRRQRMLFDICERLMQAGNEGKALPLLRSYLQEFPDGSRRRAVTLMLARAQVEMGEYAPASETLLGIIEDPGYSQDARDEAVRLLAEQYITQERYNEILELMDSAGAGRTTSLRLLRARAIRGLGRLEEAEAELAELARRNRGRSAEKGIVAELADLYLQTNRFQDCVTLLERFEPAGEPATAEDRRLILARAVSRYHLGDYQAAFEELAALDSYDAVAGQQPNQLPYIMMALSEWRLAARLLGAGFDPGFVEQEDRRLGRLLVDSLTRAGNPERAAEVLVALAESGSDTHRARLLMEAASLDIERQSKLELFESAARAASSCGERSEAMLGQASVLAAAGRRQQAVELLRRIVSDAESCPEADGSEAAWRLGELLLDSGRLAEAEEEYQFVLERSVTPERGREALSRLISCQVRQCRWERIIAAFEDFSARFGLSAIPVDAWRGYSAAQAALGDFSGAADAAARVVESVDYAPTIRPNQALLDLGWAELRAGRFEQSITIFSALASSADRGEARQAAAGHIAALLAAERWPDAAEACRRMLALSPEEWIRDWAKFTMANALLRQGGAVEAEAILRELVAANPDGLFASAAVSALKREAVSAGSFEDALRADPVLMSLSPRGQYQAFTNMRLAQRAYLAGDLQQALELYSGIPEPLQMPTDHRLRFAHALVAGQSFAEANRLLNSIDEEELSAPQRWLRAELLAATLLPLRRPHEAAGIWQRLLDEPLDGPRRLRAILGAARALDAAGRWDEGREKYELYLVEARQFEAEVEDLQRVADAFARREEYGKAAQLYSRLNLLAADPEQGVPYAFRAAQMLELQGEAENAAEEFLTIAYRHPDLEGWPAKARLSAGRIYERLGRLDAAERQYEVVAERGAGTEEGRIAAELLRSLRQRRETVREEYIRPGGA